MHPQQVSPEQVASIQRKNTQKLTWGLICLIGPTALLILSILLYAVVNFSTNQTGSGALSPPSTGVEIINFLTWIAGIATILTWLPGIILGIILIATRQRVQ